MISSHIKVYPPSISDAGKLRIGKSKFDKLACLEKVVKDVPETPTYGDACSLIVDGLLDQHWCICCHLVILKRLRTISIV